MNQMKIQEFKDEPMYALFANDGSWQGMTLAPDAASCIVLIKMLHKAKTSKSFHELSLSGFKVMPIKVTIVQNGDENKPFGKNGKVVSMPESKRFFKTTAAEVGEEEDTETEWWNDRLRPIPKKTKEEVQKYVAVQIYKGKDPNDFVICREMDILFTDQAEYYFVCKKCFSKYEEMQWSGSTKGSSGWQERAETQRKLHESMKSWCQFCDPIFGNGGWSK